CSIDEAGRFSDVSPASQKVWGYSPEELSGRLYIDFVHPDDVALTNEAARRIVSGEPLTDFENRYLRKDGRVVYMLWSARWSKEKKTMFCVARDISERKEASEVVRISEERLQLVARATNDVIWDWDLKTNELWLNEAFQTVFGYGPKEVGSDIESWSARLHPEDLETVTHEIHEGIQNGQQSWSGHYRFLRADGTYALVHDRGYVVRDENGNPVRMLGSMMDITESKRAEEELRQAKEAAEQASQAKSQFLANMSHEIRTPMNGILGPVGLLLDSDLSAQQRELAEIARSSGESLLAIINDILDLSKIEVGKLDIEPIPFNLLQAAEETASMMVSKADEKGLDLIVRCPAEVPRHVIGDPGRIRQVMANLISNAIKFTSRGHILIDIEQDDAPEVQPNNGENGGNSESKTVSLCFRIEDTGIGISKDKIEHIFGRFNQADTSTTRRYGGTGLGLAISRQLVELMGGEIGVDSKLGSGSTFWFRLNLEVQDDVPAPAQPDVDLSDVRVLVVDDNAVNRRVLHEQLDNWRLRNESCSNWKEALETMRLEYEAGDPFQIAILDHQMPDLDGEELGRLIKADPLLNETVLVMLTSLGHKGDAKRLREAGFSAYLLKPARQSELLGT
ncbi:MAG TPA: PAS domain-containing protein, partial [Abditibacteriaceae bacterium]